MLVRRISLLTLRCRDRPAVVAQCSQYPACADGLRHDDSGLSENKKLMATAGHAHDYTKQVESVSVERIERKDSVTPRDQIWPCAASPRVAANTYLLIHDTWEYSPLYRVHFSSSSCGGLRLLRL